MRRTSNPYATDGERLKWYQRFTLVPTPPRTVNERLADGTVLETTDVPTYLGRQANTDADTGLALYRLIQLWGTPNVPGMTAGAIQLERERVTWQFLFDVEYDRREDDDPKVPDSFRLSVYDDKTNVSAGLSGFGETTESDRIIQEPVAESVPSVEIPPEAFLEGVVALVLNMVEEPVPATFKELWV